jgi:hypothetical protein
MPDDMMKNVLTSWWKSPNPPAPKPSDVAMLRPGQWAPSEDEAALLFPQVDPGLSPFGSRVLVQLKVPKKKIGSLIVPEQQRDATRDNTQIAVIRAMGPLAFHNRTTLEPWPEGQWCHPGDIVLVPRFGQCERWQIINPEDGEPVEFRLYDDVGILGVCTRHPNETSWGTL